MRVLPFFKPRKGWHVAGTNLESDPGGGDMSALVNKIDLTPIILTGTTNTSGSTITSGTWFYLNGNPCIAKVDIESGATFTEGTNYEEKTIGSALTELNSNMTKHSLSSNGYDLLNLNTSESNPFVAPSDGYLMVNSGSDKGVVQIKRAGGQVYIGGGADGYIPSVTFIRKGIEMYVGSPVPAIASFYPLI